MSITIRPFEFTDFPPAHDLWANTPGIGISQHDDTPEGIRIFLERNPGLSFVALAEGELVGTILCGHDGRRGFIYHLAVVPHLRRRGIGTALADAAVNALQSNGIHRCHLFVLADNQEGMDFWLSRHWRLRDEIALFTLDIPLPNTQI
ncbi:MAG: GNAT family N-acetyltransferase [Candidatus Hydrogenedentes bacterium]|nr:GNAT family N-acetyltransferase [Candidatus Hydrogenedentota bacterium]